MPCIHTVDRGAKCIASWRKNGESKLIGHQLWFLVARRGCLIHLYQSFLWLWKCLNKNGESISIRSYKQIVCSVWIKSPRQLWCFTMKASPVFIGQWIFAQDIYVSHWSWLILPTYTPRCSLSNQSYIAFWCLLYIMGRNTVMSILSFSMSCKCIFPPDWLYLK